MSLHPAPEPALSPTDYLIALVPPLGVRCATEEPTVARWTRFGKDHLYVTHPDGTPLGYWDIATQESHPASPEYDDLLRLAVENWTSPQPTSPQRWPRVVDLFDRTSVDPVRVATTLDSIARR